VFIIIPRGFTPSACAEVVTEPEGLKALDKPNDDGRSLILIWRKMPFEADEVTYLPLLAESKDGPYYPQESLPSSAFFKSDMPAAFGFAKDNQNYHAAEFTSILIPGKDPHKPEVRPLTSGKEYFFKLNLLKGTIEIPGKAIVSATGRGNYFAFSKLNNFIIMIVFSLIVLYFINRAKKNPHLFIRRISGLEAVDDALGRATEMGKPVFFIHGISSMADVATIASINILSRIAEKVAEYDTVLKVANSDPFVLQVSQETVKESFIKAGRPDAYREENIFFAAADQFSYAAAVDGMMVREKPAANFFFGSFYAESLLLSETGASTGAIQIAGTDSWTQIPFFITTCDYTLIGEELYAASAYLSREPRLLGSLKGQDIGKAFLIIIIIIGSLLSTFGSEWFAQLFWPL